MYVLIFHNVTTLADLAARGDEHAAQDIARDKTNAKALAIFRRMPHGNDDKAPIEPGDKLAYVGDFGIEDLDATALDAANAAFAAGNAPGGPNVDLYRSWQVRSLSVGDVVIAYPTNGDKPVAYAVAGCGWQPLDADLDAYEVDVSRADLRNPGPWQKWVKRPADHVSNQSEVW
jgi:hypothetical protein